LVLHRTKTGCRWIAPGQIASGLGLVECLLLQEADIALLTTAAYTILSVGADQRQRGPRRRSLRGLLGIRGCKLRRDSNATILFCAESCWAVTPKA
jgi:hypothetical protein